jgi:hypothetical protein
LLQRWRSFGRHRRQRVTGCLADRRQDHCQALLGSSDHHSRHSPWCWMADATLANNTKGNDMNHKRRNILAAVLGTVLVFMLALPSSAFASDGSSNGATPGPLLGNGQVVRPSRSGAAVTPDALQGGGDVCNINAYALKWTSNSMAGNGYTQCNGTVAGIAMYVYADYCGPFLWGCIWQQQAEMGPPCSGAALRSLWCPGCGWYYYAPIARGQLYRTRIHVVVTWLDGSTSSGDVAYQVQF